MLRAVSCHQSQVAGYGALADLPEERQQALWGNQTFYRAMSLVNGGRAVEDDLFAGPRWRRIMQRIARRQEMI